MIEDARAQALCGDMKRCLYYETCATYGLNVERVFTEGGRPPGGAGGVGGGTDGTVVGEGWGCGWGGMGLG